MNPNSSVVSSRGRTNNGTGEGRKCMGFGGSSKLFADRDPDRFKVQVFR
jgi:hypothetical protein